jgi:recA bacterial DNA recombination protein
MSASPIFSSAAPGRPFIFSPESSSNSKKTAEILAHIGSSRQLAKVVPASRLELRASPEMVSSGIPELDLLTGGFARGCLTEICGTASSGRTSVLLLALARATQRGEVCALVDTCDAFDPASAVATGMEMSRLLWVRCGQKSPSGTASVQAGHRKTASLHSRSSYPRDSYQGMPSGISKIERNEFGFSRWQSQLAQLLKVTDLLLQSSGFGMIALDLSDVPPSSARKIPLASWFRFRRAIEHTPTVLLVLEQQPIAGSCSSMLLRFSAVHSRLKKKPSVVDGQLSANQTTHSELLNQLEITAELLQSRLERKSERKPVRSTANFKSRAAWAG